MKTLKFSPELVKLVQNGTKTTTWRLFDDKNIQVGDEITLIKKPELVPFAEVVVEEVTIKPLGLLDKNDKQGHEEVGSDENMYKTYSQYYNKEVGPETEVKVIKFKVKN